MKEDLRVRVPRFLQVEADLIRGRSVGDRPQLHIDDVDCNGTALDVVRGRPLYKTKLLKKLKRQVAELEELRAFVESKGNRNLTQEELISILKD